MKLIAKNPIPEKGKKSSIKIPHKQIQHRNQHHFLLNRLYLHPLKYAKNQLLKINI
jgi:hypothetical protein